MKTTIKLFAMIAFGMFCIMLFDAVYAPPAQAHRYAWQDCPGLPGATAIPRELQHEAWNRAKRLAGIESLKDWKLPCKALRYEAYFIGDPDGPGGFLPEATYAGLHHPPEPFVDVDTGQILSCEYITIHLPPEDEYQLMKILTHEYLHAIFLRVWATSMEFRMMFPDPNTHSEIWVRILMDDTDWLKKHDLIDEETGE